MSSNQANVWQLAAQVRNGDDSASGTFLSELEQQMGRILRRYVRAGGLPADIRRWIETLLGQQFSAFDAADESWLKAATRRICHATLRAIRAPSPAAETIRGL